MKPQPIFRPPEYEALKQLASTMPHLKDLFAQNPDRAKQMTVSAPGILLDFSKQRVTQAVLFGLEQLYYQQKLPEAIADLFSGQHLNPTENRPALHTQLRVPPDRQPMAYQDVEYQLQRLEQLVDQVHMGVRRGFSGKRITDVVNLGVGGSDLGPLMVSQALKEYATPQAKRLQVHFASTLDGSQIFELLQQLNPETTLFLIASKSFTTIDTLSNADTVRQWIRQSCRNDALVMRCHFIGISAHADRMDEWGILPDNQLLLWPWVGGRFSLWSTIGTAIALALGAKAFRQLLAGAHRMDQHFLKSPPLNNLPVLMALVGVWNINFLGVDSHAILPYDGRLKYLPPYIEQLEMESNGKSITTEGKRVDFATSPIIWGEIGANAQHAFYQLLHQGTVPVVADFIIAAQRYESHIGAHHYAELVAQHELNLANCLAQSRALAFGNATNNPPQNEHKVCAGNQASSTLLLDELNPYTLGSLLACYEHKVFTQARLWGINPFDQWGVELGKQVALQLQPLITPGDESSPSLDRSALDSSTLQLAARIAQLRGQVT